LENQGDQGTITIMKKSTQDQMEKTIEEQPLLISIHFTKILLIMLKNVINNTEMKESSLMSLSESLKLTLNKIILDKILEKTLEKVLLIGMTLLL